VDQTKNPPQTGQLASLAPGIRRIIAPNPSPMTLWGTNTYVLGQGEVAVIDPGPRTPDHLSALLAGLEPGETVALILVTHAHRDHSPLAADLAQETGAPVLAYGDWTAGRSPMMQGIAERGGLGGGEGVDAEFAPDRCLADGETVDWAGGEIRAIWTPGHFSNHMSFAWQDTLFCGDHVMGWASSLVSPPDGDLTAFMQSCRRLLERPESTYYPGHGAPIFAPHDRLRWLIDHRQMREAQILEALASGAATPAELAQRIYHDLAPALMGAATRNVLAHLLHLLSESRVATTDPDADIPYSKAHFALV